MIHIADFAVISRTTARACHAAPAIYASSCERETQKESDSNYCPTQPLSATLL